ncbi:MAG: ADP-glyceromanno-heptose 6-epimerase [Bacteriovoracaceae bacterium]|nr:ADP-glyceromanno-heptose 6-epimerase [Bacteriovoracaceae bacterium]
MIIVTGGAGFIGSALIYELNKLKIDNIIIVDRLHKDKRWLNIRGLKYDTFIHADDFLSSNILDNSALKGVFHLGACSATTETDVDYLMKNNVEYSKKIFQACAEKNIPLVYASSAATYGSGEYGYDDSHEVVSKLKPLNPYGYSKQFFDEWVLRQKRKPNKWFGVKFFNVFGPNEYHKGSMASVVFHAHNQIKDTGKVKLFNSYNPEFEDGEQKRDFVYVKDVCLAMLKLMNDAKPEASGIYNLGTGVARSFNDLTKATFTAMKKAPKIEYIEMPETLRSQYQYFTQAKMEKFNNLFPDFKFRSLEDAVADYHQHLMQTDHYLSWTPDAQV